MKISNRQEAGINVAKLLQDVGYISEKRKEELIYMIKTGDRAAYSELQVLLIVMAEELDNLKK